MTRPSRYFVVRVLDQSIVQDPRLLNAESTHRHLQGVEGRQAFAVCRPDPGVGASRGLFLMVFVASTMAPWFEGFVYVFNHLIVGSDYLDGADPSQGLVRGLGPHLALVRVPGPIRAPDLGLGHAAFGAALPFQGDVDRQAFWTSDALRGKQHVGYLYR